MKGMAALIPSLYLSAQIHRKTSALSEGTCQRVLINRTNGASNLRGPNFSALVDALVDIRHQCGAAHPLFFGRTICRQAIWEATSTMRGWSRRSRAARSKDWVSRPSGPTCYSTGHSKLCSRESGRTGRSGVVPGAAVLIFFWGAFSLINVTGPDEKSWLFAPTLGMLAYGLVFELGFMNFLPLKPAWSSGSWCCFGSRPKSRPLIALAPHGSRSVSSCDNQFAWAANGACLHPYRTPSESPRARRLFFSGRSWKRWRWFRMMIMRSYQTTWSFADVVTLKGFFRYFLA